MKNAEIKKYWKEERESTIINVDAAERKGDETVYVEHKGATPSSIASYRKNIIFTKGINIGGLNESK